MGKIREFVNKTLENLGYVNQKSWANVFDKAQEYLLFSDRINRPYEQVPSVYKAVKALCDNVPQAEIIFRDWETQEEVETAPTQELINLFRNPNPEQSQNDFIQECVGHYALDGEVFILKVQSVGQRAGSTKIPSQLIAYPKKDVTKNKNASGKVSGYTIEKVDYPLDSVIHVKDFNPYDKTCGTSPTTPIEKIMSMDYKSMVYNESFFDNFGAPPYALSTEKSLTEVQRERLIRWWEERHKGAKNAHKIGILEGGLEPKTFGLSQKDMDFIEQKRFTREEMLGNWRAPKALFNITEDLNYATFQGQIKIFWLYALMPMLRKFEDALNRHLIFAIDPKIYMEFDTRTVPAFQEDLKDKAATAFQLWQMGVPLNELNEKLDLGFDGDYPWGETWWIGFGLHAADEPVDEFALEPVTEGKSFAKSETKMDSKNVPIWKAFVAKGMGLEIQMSKMISKFFYRQRNEVLTAFMNAHKGFDGEVKKESAPINITIDWNKFAVSLIDKSKPYIQAGLIAGVSHAASVLKPEGIDLVSINEKVNGHVAGRVKKIGFSQETVKDRVTNAITDGIKEGKTVLDIADDIRDVYNVAGNRALMIARTNITGALNDGSLLYYSEAGIEQVAWLTAGDEFVRDSHRDQNGDTVPVGTPFKNGLRFPGDDTGDVGEIANCRCTLLPVL